MSEKINGTLNPDRKMLYHSSHDFMLFGLLNAFGFTNTGIINPSTTLITELHYDKKEDNYYVKVKNTEMFSFNFNFLLRII